jgi:hypothetical protein
MAAAFILLFIPFYSGGETIDSRGGLTQISVSNVTLLEANGGGLLFVLIFPWLTTGVAVFSTIMGAPRKMEQSRVLWRWRSYSWAASVVLLAFVFLSLSTVGLFYIPALLLTISAAFFNR